MDVLWILIGLVVVFFLYRTFVNRNFIEAHRLMSRLSRLAQEPPDYSDLDKVFSQPSKYEIISSELYAFCITNEHQKKTVDKYNATLDDFKSIYMSLSVHCPAEIKGYYIPVAAFFFKSTLDYILANRNNSHEVTRYLMNYFERI